LCVTKIGLLGDHIVIGAGVLGTAGDANKIRIGNSTHTATFIGGIYNKTEGGTIKPVYINSQLGTQPPASSRRFKEAIKPMDKTSEAVLGLKPVTFHYKSDSSGYPAVWINS
jgi:Chaperone of endosialidase